ncbi:MAG: LLM class flavin-dependent oxidoreductase [Candidatus Bathyarchaeia archaeon]
MKFGISITPNKPISEWIKLVKIAEAYGFEHAWVADESPSPPFRDVFVTLSALAMSTERIRLGTSVCNPYTRHFAMIALAILSLDELSNGRAVLGIGPGGSLTLSPLKLKMWHRPIETVKESVRLLKNLFSGEAVDSDEEFLKAKGIRLFDFPKHGIPIYLAARSSRMLRLVGEVADGALLSSLPAPYVKEALRHIREGALDSKRSFEGLDIAHISRLSISYNRREAREVIRSNIAYSVADSPIEVLERFGIKRKEWEALRKALNEKGLEFAKDFVTDRMIDTLAIAGSPEECVKRCKEYIEAGATQLVFSSPFSPNPEEGLKLLSEEVIPRLGSAK